VKESMPWPPDAALCKGDWSLGTACGHCQRCIERAPKAAAELYAALAAMRKEIADLPGHTSSRFLTDEEHAERIRRALRIIDVEIDSAKLAGLKLDLELNNHDISVKIWREL
jgi:hypothetical protein